MHTIHCAPALKEQTDHGLSCLLVKIFKLPYFVKFGAVAFKPSSLARNTQMLAIRLARMLAALALRPVLAARVNAVAPGALLLNSAAAQNMASVRKICPRNYVSETQQCAETQLYTKGRGKSTAQTQKGRVRKTT